MELKTLANLLCTSINIHWKSRFFLALRGSLDASIPLHPGVSPCILLSSIPALLGPALLISWNFSEQAVLPIPPGCSNPLKPRMKELCVGLVLEWGVWSNLGCGTFPTHGMGWSLWSQPKPGWDSLISPYKMRMALGVIPHTSIGCKKINLNIWLCFLSEKISYQD